MISGSLLIEQYDRRHTKKGWAYTSNGLLSNCKHALDDNSGFDFDDDARSAEYDLRTLTVRDFGSKVAGAVHDGNSKARSCRRQRPATTLANHSLLSFMAARARATYLKTGTVSNISVSPSWHTVSSNGCASKKKKRRPRVDSLRISMIARAHRLSIEFPTHTH
jgi:hypothetical protein